MNLRGIIEMNIDVFIPYAPLLIIIIAFCWQFQVFVTPEKLSKRLREEKQTLVFRDVYQTAMENIQSQINTIKANHITKEEYRATVKSLTSDISEVKNQLGKFEEKFDAKLDKIENKFDLLYNKIIK